MNTAELADGIEAGLEAASTPERREAGAAYIKTGLRVIGTATPPMRAVVREFLGRHDGELAAHVKREVRAKLETGRKNPKRAG